MKNILENFKRLLLTAEILDTRYVISGTMTWLPYGVRIRRKFIDVVEKILEKHGYEPYLYPLIIPRSALEKISTTIHDFRCNVLSPDLDHILSPTGELVIYPQWNKLIRSNSDLPLKVYQVNSIFRKRSKKGLFLPVHQDLFVEAHSAHATYEEAKVQFDVTLRVIQEILHTVGVTVLMSERPLETNNLVSERTVGFDMILPNGRTIQVASAYLQSQVFSKVFDIGFSASNGTRTHTYQTTFGFSSRLLLSSLWVNHDVTGIRLLRILRPWDVVIHPILSDSDNKNQEIISICLEISNELELAGIHTDISQLKKHKSHTHHHSWKVRGIPLQLTIGRRELEDSTVTILRRCSVQKLRVSRDHIEDVILQYLCENDEIILQFAQDRLRDLINSASSISQLRSILTDGYPALIRLCRKTQCLHKIESKASGEVLGYSEILDEGSSPCIECGSITKTMAYFAKRI